MRILKAKPINAISSHGAKLIRHILYARTLMYFIVCL